LTSIFRSNASAQNSSRQFALAICRDDQQQFALCGCPAIRLAHRKRLQVELREGSTAPINLEKIMLSGRRVAVSLNAGSPQVLYP
jgi:hypothetical protein